MRSASPHQRMIIATVLAGVALLAALWFLAISPKREESAEVRDNVAAQEARLSAARTQLAGYETARREYPQKLRELRRLDEAVPARGAIPSLLRQLQRRARTRGSDLRLAALKPAAIAPPTAPATPATSATSATSATPAAAPPKLTPGAAQLPGGLAALPFSFTYTGKYFDLVHVLAAARRSVAVKSGKLKIDGRLVTIEGLSFERADPAKPLIKASVSGTAYIASATPQPAAVPAPAPTSGGS